MTKAMNKNKHVIVILSLLIISLFLTIQTVNAENNNQINIEIFRVDECGHCQEAENMINQIITEYDNITLNVYYIDDETKPENLQKFKDYALINSPAVVITNETNHQVLKLQDESKINKDNIIAFIEGNYSESEEKSVIDFLGMQIDLSQLSLPVLTIILGAIDSLNPCSFFVLLFLLSILLYTKSRKKMILIGGIFIFFSGLIYFLMMSAILNVLTVVAFETIIALVAGIIAIIFGILNIKDFFYYKKGPTASISKEKKGKLFRQMRKIIKITSIPSLIAATVILAISANSVELLCSFNLPVIYTQALDTYSMGMASNYLYLILYNIIYIIPLLIILGIMVITLGRWKLSEFQGRILKLFAGTMILSLGIILITKPSLLNNVLITLGLVFICFITTTIISIIWKKLFENQKPKKN
jgi:glutaredoxin